MIIASGFYARQNIKTPVKIGLVTLLATQAMNLLFIFVLGMQHAGLALGLALGFRPGDFSKRAIS